MLYMLKAGSPSEELCRSQKTRTDNSHTTSKMKNKEDKKDDMCRYCKETVRCLNTWPEFEKRKNKECKLCGKKGHYRKNFQEVPR